MLNVVREWKRRGVGWRTALSTAGVYLLLWGLDKTATLLFERSMKPELLDDSLSLIRSIVNDRLTIGLFLMALLVMGLPYLIHAWNFLLRRENIYVQAVAKTNDTEVLVADGNDDESILAKFEIYPAIVGTGHEARPIILRAVNGTAAVLKGYSFLLNAVAAAGRHKQYMSIELKPPADQCMGAWYPGEVLEIWVCLSWFCGSHSNGAMSLLTANREIELVKDLTSCELSISVHVPDLGSAVDDVKIKYDKRTLGLKVYPTAAHRLEALDKKHG